jgi:hypothetical protein
VFGKKTESNGDYVWKLLRLFNAGGCTKEMRGYETQKNGNAMPDAPTIRSDATLEDKQLTKKES